MKYSYSDAFYLAGQIIKEKTLKITIMSLFLLSLTGSINYVIINNYESIINKLKGKLRLGNYISIFLDESTNLRFIIFLLILLLIRVIITTHSITLIQSFLNNKKDCLRSTLSGIKYYIVGSIIMYLCIS